MRMKRGLTFTFMLVILGSTITLANGRPGESYQVDNDKNSTRTTSRGSYLDIGVVDVTPERAASLKLKDNRGALVTQLGQDGPAAKAGLQKDDVIIKWNGEPIEGVVEFWRRKRETPGGRAVRLGVIRDGREIELNVTLGESLRSPRVLRYRSREARRPARAISVTPRIQLAPRIKLAPRIARAPRIERAWRLDVRGSNRLGLKLESLTPQLAEHFGLTTQTGALISWVQADSPSAKAGLRAGDVVISVAGQPIESGFDVGRATRGRAEGPLEVKVIRDKQERTFTVQLEKVDSSVRRLDDDDFDEMIIALPEIAIQEIELPEIVIPEISFPEILIPAIEPIVVSMPKIDLRALAPVVVPMPLIKIAPIAPIKIAPIKIAPIKIQD